MIEKTGKNCPVKSIAQDQHGILWFGTLGKGVFSYDGKVFTHYTEKEGLASNWVYSVCFDRSGNTWFGLDRGACLYDGRTFRHFTAREGFSSSYVFNIICEKNGNVWFATDTDGVFMFDGNTFTRFTEKEGLGNNSVYSLFQDRSGNIWFGGNGSGVSLYKGRSMTHFTEKEGLSDKRVLSVLQDQSGDLWFGTWGGGACRYSGSSFSHFTEKEGLCNALITAMCQEKNGNIWFGTFGEGAVCFDGKSFSHFTAKEGLAFDYVESIFQDTAGNIWFATNGGGVCRYDGKTFTTWSEKQGLSFNDVMHAMQDNKGNLWFATSRGGVNRFDGKTFTHYTAKEGLTDDYATRVFQDKYGNIWLGTNNGGACYFDGKSMVWFTEKEGLCSNSIKSIIQDNEGNLWFSSPNGVSKLPAVYLTIISDSLGKGGIQQPVLFKNYTYEDGLLGISCFPKALFCDRSGTVWIGTSDRLTAYHPEGNPPDTIAPNIQLAGILLFNENISWPELMRHKDTSLVLGNGITLHDFGFDSLSAWYGIPENLTLAYNNNFLTFSFIGISQEQSKKVRYRFKLEGLDENWSALTSRTEAPYGNIPHGTYTFKVKAMNSEGYWSKEFNYTFTIRPPWWKTWWAYTGYILLIVAAFGAVIYSILENQRKKIRLIMNERNRIARELHDDIGAELTRITILSQSLQKNKTLDEDIQVKHRKISETGKKVLGSIGEIIWTMNPQKDNLDSLAAYIRRFVTEYFEANDIDLHIEFPNEIPANAISDEYRRNVFLVIKEAMSNISKYSKATQVKLSLNIGEKLAAFEISDNGTGFSMKEKENWGNGLRNMNQRMRDIGGTFLIRSEINQGTFIKVTFPVR
jgi:signal transduction histidine kinase/ligand-binding sensor domain-containing protein